MDQTSELGLPVFIILCGVLGMLILALAVIIFFMIYQKRLYDQQETLLKMERDYQNNLLKHSFESQEEAYKRIAADLHDDLGSTLSAIRIYVHQLNPKLPNDNYQELKVDTISLIDNTIDQLRGIAHNLFPPNLDRFGLLQASKDFCQRIQKIDGIDIQFNYDEPLSISKLEALTLYRILQELSNNTLKHAAATSIVLQFSNIADGFKMSFRDNGKGFLIDKSTPIGLGVKNIESRANSIGANMFIQSKPGAGVYFELLLPTASKG